MRELSKLIGLIVGLLLLASKPTMAHRQKIAFSNVEWNERAGTIEVIHRFNTHDAEHAVTSLFGKTGDIISQKKTQEQFAAYVFKHFSLKDGLGNPIPLTNVGFEVDRGHLWIYQETKLDPKLKQIQVKATALHEHWAAHLNQVNFKRFGQVRSLRFAKNSDWQTILVTKDQLLKSGNKTN